MPIARSSPVVDPFDPPYEVWSERKMTDAEVLEHLKQFGHFASTTKDKLLGKIGAPIDAAVHAVAAVVDERLNSYLERQIASSPGYDAWRRAMPSQTPSAIAKYQKDFPNYDARAVDEAIARNDFCLPVGQALFHGGLWPNPASRSFVTDRPLSTTLLPSVALRNAEHGGKAYHAGEMQLMVLTVRAPTIKAFVLRKSGTLLGHEHEVLLPSNIRLTLQRKLRVRGDYPCGLDPSRTKAVPGFVLEVDVG